MTCLWIGCDQAPSRRGICSRHYQRTLAAGMKASKPIPVSVPERLDELAHLIAGGVWPPTAVERCGWSLGAAEIAARREGRPLSTLLRRYIAMARSGELVAS